MRYETWLPSPSMCVFVFYGLGLMHCKSHIYLPNHVCFQNVVPFLYVCGRAGELSIHLLGTDVAIQSLVFDAWYWY